MSCVCCVRVQRAAVAALPTKDRNMKLLLAACAALLALTGAAAAADLGSIKDTPAGIAVGNSWTGCRLGIGAGYNTEGAKGVFTGTESTTLSSDSALGSLTAGCDRQFGNIVLGAFIEGDILHAAFTNTGGASSDSALVTGGRAGVVFGTTLIFAEAGETFSGFSSTKNFKPDYNAPFLGAGLAAPLDRNWSIEFDGRYGFQGDKASTAAGSQVISDAAVAQIKLNYLFSISR
jgi:outer membrane immunogenic protein